MPLAPTPSSAAMNAANNLKSKNGRRAFARVISLALPVALAVGWTIPVCAEPSVGLTGGLTLSGHQDVTLVNSGQGVESRDVSAAGALVGVAFPVTSHVRVRAEVRYLLTHDMDPKAGRGISTEVSGSRGSNPGRALFGPHFDSEFVPLLIGLDYVF